MKSGTVDELRKVLMEEEKNLNNDNKLREFEEASKFFEDLVKKGIVKKRGNNLMPVDKAHLHREKFNTSEEQNFM